VRLHLLSEPGEGKGEKKKKEGGYAAGLSILARPPEKGEKKKVEEKEHLVPVLAAREGRGGKELENPQEGKSRKRRLHGYSSFLLACGRGGRERKEREKNTTEE